MTIQPNDKVIKTCSFCESQIGVEDGVICYDRQWFHNKCWKIFEKKKGDDLK